jgi:acetyl esterase/lipase
MGWRLAFACALASGCAAVAQLPQPLPAVASQPVEQDHYPAPPFRFANGVRGVPAVVYRTQPGYRPLTLDLYLPPATARKPAHGFPLVVYIHGGALGGDWMGGDSRRSGVFVDFPAVLAALAARGYVVAAVDYRLSSVAIFPAQIQDVKAAIKFLRLHAAGYAIDPARAIAWGASAGAHLAALAAVSCGAQPLEPRQTTPPATPENPAGTAAPSDVAVDVSDCVQASVAWFGVFDMATIQVQARQDGATSRDQPDAPEWRLLGCFAGQCSEGQLAAASPVAYVNAQCQCSEGQLAAASPVAYVNAQTPPMLLIVGDQDKTVPQQQTLEMAETLKQAGVEHELMVIPGVGHAFIGKTPAETRDANLAALEATFRFIDQTMHAAQ